MSDSAPSKPKRRWCQSRLRSLLVFGLVIVAGAAICPYGLKMLKERNLREQARKHREVIEEGKRRNERVVKELRGLGMSARWLGDVLDPAFYVLQSPVGITDADLECLDGFTNLRELNLFGTQVTNDGLQHVGGQTNLRKLWLSETRVTDDGLEHLRGLTELQSLDLAGTRVTDTGLNHVKGLISLQWLNLYQTEITDKSVKKLQQALPDCTIGH